MRSGFLNVVPSACTALGSIAQEKCSRSKRKFKPDAPFHLPLPELSCDEGRNDENGSMNGNAWMDSQCLEALAHGDENFGMGYNNADCSATPVRGNDKACQTLHDQHNAEYFTPGHAKSPCSEQVSYTCESTTNSESFEIDQDFEGQQEPDWDNLSETQLEEMLVNLLDSVYKDAIKRITSTGINEHDALRAVLQNGRCYSGRDALKTVIDNALAYLKSTEPTIERRNPLFTELKQMEVYVLAEMVCAIRMVRPFLSRGDAMWCLLMCDMNVAHACAMEDDAMSKDESLGVASLLPNGGATVSLPLISSGINPPSQERALLSHTVLQPSCSSTVCSNRDGPSAFSAPNFSSSGGNATASFGQEDSNNSCSTGSLQGSASSSCTGALHLKQEQQVQMVDLSPSQDLQLPTTSESGSHSLGAGSRSYKFPTGNYSHYTSILPSSQLPADSSEKFCNQLVVSGTCVETSQLQATSVAYSNQVVNFAVANPLPMLPVTKVPFPSSNAVGSTMDHGLKSITFQLPVGIDDQLQTQFEIGNSTMSVGSVVSRKVQTGKGCENDASFASAGADLSCAISSEVNSGVTTSLNDRRLSTGIEESIVCNSSHVTPNDQIFEGAGGNGGDRKTEMLVQLIHHVKEIEAQLQEWTEWTQQKVMQTTRRLSKDTAELKALRQEKKDCLFLKKEKQTLEENTMKKLFEMENALRKASGQVDRANAAVRRLEADNEVLRAEMEAAKMNAAESVATCQEATMREISSVRKSEGWGKHKVKLQEELAEGKRKQTFVQQQLSQAKERCHQFDVKWRQERRGKEEALLRAEAEKQAKEHAGNIAKRRQEELRRKTKADSQRYRNDIRRLEGDIAQLKVSSETSILKWGNSFGVPSHNTDTCSAQGLKQSNTRLLCEIEDLQDLSQRDVYRDRECVMCLSEEMSVVFLPCAHQVVCVKCNEVHEKQGLQDCPSCRTPIQQRICVYGVSS